MASMDVFINEFIIEYELDPEIKTPICELFGKCVEALAKHLMKESIPESDVKTKATKVLKADKIEDPTTCESFEQLNNCSTGVLNQFLGDSGLKKGGNKKELKDRVWRFLQGTGSDEDKSPRNKPKAVKKVAEKHACYGCNAKGAPCSVAGTEEFSDQWFCWRHISDAEEFMKKKVNTDDGESSEVKAKVVASKEPKVVSKKPVVKADKKTSKKKGKEVELEEELVEELSEEEED